MLWDSIARELGGALSRYNGLTNSVNLESVHKVVTCDLFYRHSYRYAHEVINKFLEHVKEGAKRSAEVYLQHAILFGFLHKPSSNSEAFLQKAGRKIEKNSHIALTPLGRACRAAEYSDIPDGSNYKKFLWEYALLECDFDLYGLFISMSKSNNGEIVDRNDLYNSFYDLCEKKSEWLEKKFPTKSQRAEIQRHVTWMGEKKGKSVNKFPRKIVIPNALSYSRQAQLVKFSKASETHHFLQRKKWANIWGHMDANDTLTNEGDLFASRIPSLSKSSPFLWLAPPKKYVERFISDEDVPQKFLFSPAWDLLRPKQEVSNHEKLVDMVADYMKNAFDNIRMGHFNQAPLTAVTPYIYFLECKFNKRADEHALFRSVLEKHRDLSCLLHKDISRCHYRTK